MRVLIVSQEPPFDPETVATGNALRGRQLRRALEGAGHETRHVWLAPRARGEAGRAGAPPEANGAFRSRDQLRARIAAEAPDVVLVAWWELVNLLPFDLAAPGDRSIPVVLDFVAPRPLETLFEAPERVAAELRRLRLALRRCELLLVGNEAQAGLLAWWLLEAGFDLRRDTPVRVVPLAGEARPGHPPDPGQAGFTLVGGGVDWPWRQSRAYTEAIHRFREQAGGRLRLVQFGGRYRHHPESASADDETPQAAGPEQALDHYGDYESFLGNEAHIGLELGDDNIERRFSQSFRSLDFLCHGLPLICSAHLPIARRVSEYDAGWPVDEPGDLPAVLAGILADPAAWRERRENALRLVRDTMNPESAAAPLLEWLGQPRAAERLPVHGLPDRAPPVIGVPPLRERLARRYRLARRVLLARWLGRRPRTDAIVMVSRGDVFPPDHGAAVKIVETARGLSRQGREVALVTDARDHYWRFRDGEAERVALPRWLRLFARPLPWVKLDHYTRDIPESNAFLYLPLTDRSFFWRTLYVAGRSGAGVLQAEFPAYARPCVDAAEVLGAATVLVEHNVEYERMRAQVPELSDAQYRRLRAIEIDLCNRVDAVICVSDNDRQRLAEDGVHPGLLHTVPHGIDLAGFDAATPAPARERFDIPDDAPLLAYHGTFAYPPNRDALQMFADQILPRLETRGVTAYVLAIGHSPPEGLHPRIHCTGSVESVAPWLKAADLAVVPLREGGGTRMKIVDCFAAGLPVISTAKGIEGIPAADGREALIRDDWSALSEAIVEVLEDPALADSLRQAGRALAKTLDWQAITARYLKLHATLG